MSVLLTEIILPYINWHTTTKISKLFTDFLIFFHLVIQYSIYDCELIILDIIIPKISLKMFIIITITIIVINVINFGHI